MFKGLGDVGSQDSVCMLQDDRLSRFMQAPAIVRRQTRPKHHRCVSEGSSNGPHSNLFVAQEKIPRTVHCCCTARYREPGHCLSSINMLAQGGQRS